VDPPRRPRPVADPPRRRGLGIHGPSWIRLAGRALSQASPAVPCRRPHRPRSVPRPPRGMASRCVHVREGDGVEMRGRRCVEGRGAARHRGAGAARRGVQRGARPMGKVKLKDKIGSTQPLWHQSTLNFYGSAQ